jgi:glutathione synthase/RimK-type ligase-like ATP-grasp enzyme
METLVVVTHAKDWPLKVKGGRVVTARSYLMDAEFSNLRRAKVFNLCRQYRYQTYGYYVSLLAEARGHKPIPTAATMQDLRSPAHVRMASDELQEKIEKSLGPIQSDRFVLSIYFGRNVAKRHDELAMALFKLFPSPFLRATFVREEEWELQNLTAIPASAIPDEHREFAFGAAQTFFTLPSRRRARSPARFDLAILHDEKDPTAPSDKKAIERFAKAAEDMDIDVEVISKEDYGRVAQFDALFIRATTGVNHYTYRFSSRAAAEGLVVIDDPTSILRCTNKVYLAELFTRNGIRTPRTRIVHKENFVEVIHDIGFPCILKQPDSSSSLGVVKADRAEELRGYAAQLFETSELLIAQEFLPTQFDWRIGILDRRPLFAARYFMAPDHWQIIKRDDAGRTAYGNIDILPVEEVPHLGLRLALRSANLIGDGFYGVDLKQVGKDWYLIEINDNPSVEYRVEDRYLREDLYRRVMAVFLRRIEERKEGRSYR